MVDKAVKRTSASDWWTRDLRVSFTVSDPKRWEKVADRLNTALYLSVRRCLANLVSSIAVQIIRRTKSWPQESAAARRAGHIRSCVAVFWRIGLAYRNDRLSCKRIPTNHLLMIGHYDASGPHEPTKKRLRPNAFALSGAYKTGAGARCAKTARKTRSPLYVPAPSCFWGWAYTQLRKLARPFRCSLRKME